MNLLYQDWRDKMQDYFLSTKKVENARIHAASCPNLPKPDDRKYLGKYMSPHGAYFEAKRYNRDAKLCVECAAKS